MPSPSGNKPPHCQDLASAHVCDSDTTRRWSPRDLARSAPASALLVSTIRGAAFSRTPASSGSGAARRIRGGFWRTTASPPQASVLELRNRTRRGAGVTSAFPLAAASFGHRRSCVCVFNNHWLLRWRSRAPYPVRSQQHTVWSPPTRVDIAAEMLDLASKPENVIHTVVADLAPESPNPSGARRSCPHPYRWVGTNALALKHHCCRRA